MNMQRKRMPLKYLVRSMSHAVGIFDLLGVAEFLDSTLTALNYVPTFSRHRRSSERSERRKVLPVRKCVPLSSGFVVFVQIVVDR